MSRKQQHEVKNNNRRTILAVGLTGAVAFIAGKIFGGGVETLLGQSGGQNRSTEFQNFKLTETGKEITLSEKGGEPIFIIDKESFKK